MNSLTITDNHPFFIQLTSSLLVLFAFLIAKRLLCRLAIHFISKIRFKKVKLDTASFVRLQKPLNYLFLFFGIYLALAISPVVYFSDTATKIFTLGSVNIPIHFLSINTLNKYYGVIFIGILTWIIYHLEHIYEQLFNQFNMQLSLVDNTLFVRYIARMIRFITVILGISLMLITLIPNLSGIITGVGIGGAAVAIVAKDSIADIFSGMILLLDKPFIIGDWIEIDTTEGIVEDISFRSTRIRTFTQGLMIIPNTTVGNANVINWSHMTKRRVKFNLKLAYNTSSTQITQCTENIRKRLLAYGDIDPESILVHFEHIDDYALSIQISYFIMKTDYSSYVQVKEKVNLDILELCKEYHITIALPTQTLIVQSK